MDFRIEPPRPSTRFIRLRLPAGQTFRTGDHIAVYAHNCPELVDCAIARLSLDGAAQFRLDGQGSRFRHLPLGELVTVRQLLSDFVELSDPLPRRALPVITSRCPDTTAKLATLSEYYDEEVAAKRLTLLDLLDLFPAAELTLDQLVELSAPIVPRYYSIASSPLVSPDIVDLLVGTTFAPAWSGLGEHRGFPSSYMAGDAARGRAVRLFSPSQPALRAAHRPRDADDPDRPRHRIRPLRGFAGTRGAARRGQESALLRLPPPRPRLVLPRRDGAGPRRRPDRPVSPLSPPSPNTLGASSRTRCGPNRNASGRRWRRVRKFSFVVTAATWRRPSATR